MFLICLSSGPGPSSPVDHFVGGVLVEGVIESEGLVLQVSGQVNFLFGLMDHDHVFTGNGDHVQLLDGGLCRGTEQSLSEERTRAGLAHAHLGSLTFFIERTCTYAHAYSMLFDLEEKCYSVRVPATPKGTHFDLEITSIKF